MLLRTFSASLRLRAAHSRVLRACLLYQTASPAPSHTPHCPFNSSFSTHPHTKLPGPGACRAFDAAWPIHRKHSHWLQSRQRTESRHESGSDLSGPSFTQLRGYSSSSQNGSGHDDGEQLLQPPEPLEAREREKAAYQRELKTVTVAITANIIIFFCKAVTCWMTGSSAMFGEAVHSVADTMNQVLLRFGILTSRQAPTDVHPYGYLKDKFLWSLISAVGIFCLGSGVTVAHGVMTLGAPAAEVQLQHLGWNAAVLVLSFIMEGYSLMVATRAVVQGATSAGLTFWEYVKRGMDPTSVAVMLEDGAAVTGLIIAGIATGLVHFTGNPVWDGLGSITIGVLLGATAWYLIAQNRSFLIGRAMNSSDMQRVLQLLKSDYVVKAVHDVKSEEIGPGIYRFKAEMEFFGERVVERHLERLGGTDLLHHQMRSAFMTGRPETLDLFLHQYGSSTIKALGAEVDRLEAAIVHLVPGIRHIDLETDRGRSDKTRKDTRSMFDTMGSVDLDLEGTEALPTPTSTKA